MLCFQSRQLLFLLFICRARLIVEALECRPSYGVNILAADCHHALWDLSTVSIRENIWEAPRLQRRFSKDPSYQKRDRMPQGFSFQSCSIGIDILDPPPGTDRPAYVEADWVDLWEELVELVRRCVAPRGIGGGTQAHGFSFTIINPNTGLGQGLCMAPNQPIPMDMGRCIAGRAEAIARAQRTHAVTSPPEHYYVNSQGSATQPQQHLNWDPNTLGRTGSGSGMDLSPQRAALTDPSATDPPTDDSNGAQSPREKTPPIG